MNKVFIKIEFSNELAEKLTHTLQDLGIKLPPLNDGDVHTLNLDSLLQKSGIPIDTVMNVMTVIKSSVESASILKPGDLFFIKNESTGEWLKPMGEGYGFEEGIKSSAAFSADNAAMVINELQQEMPEFEYITVPMMDEIMKDKNK